MATNLKARIEVLEKSTGIASTYEELISFLELNKAIPAVTDAQIHDYFQNLKLQKEQHHAKS